MGRSSVGVVPERALSERPRLFEALAAAFDVSFPPARDGIAGALAFGCEPPPGVPALVLADARCRAPAVVELCETPALDPRLRGRVLGDRSAGGAALETRPGDVVLATAEGRPVWARGETWRSAVAPDELAGAESLRDQLVDGRFLGLLPVVALLREVLPDPWEPPPPRACFVLDDPNLHRTTYGHADFAQLAAHAARHGYHVTVATVPADHWFVSRRAAAIFHDNPTLSLALHGNSHAREELACEDGEALVAQALRRIERLEQRAGVRVGRVMVAPHERVSASMVETLVRSEVEALCYGWGDRSPQRPLADFAPTELRGSGLPVLPRRPLLASRGELALRAYLDQPLILGLHHGDLAGGLDPLADAAADLERIAQPRWLSLDAIARAGITTRRVGSTLHVRAYARRFSLTVPDGVDEVVLGLPPTHAAPERELLLEAGREYALDGSFAVEPGEALSFALRRIDAFDHESVPAPPGSLWHVERRFLVESRDRLTALRPLRRRT